MNFKRSLEKSNSIVVVDDEDAQRQQVQGKQVKKPEILVTPLRPGVDVFILRHDWTRSS